MVTHLPISFADIEAACERIKGAVIHSPERESATLSEIAGADIFLKFENRQFTASFKERGALNCLASLSETERQKGVIAMSAGNHAQGVAYHASRLHIPSWIVMPENTPIVKVKHTMAHGAEVLLHGETLVEATDFAKKLAYDRGHVFVHPYDDPRVMAGQGTIAVEMLQKLPFLDTLVIPIGGGGLISGIAVAAKHINPAIKIVGVQTALYPAMKKVLAGEEATVGGSTIAEGIAVKQPGELTRTIVQALVDDIILVTEEELEASIVALVNIEKTVVEGAGAAGLAAVLQQKDRFKGRKVGLVLCGGNIDQRLLATVLMRDLVRAGRFTRIRINLTDRSGELALVADLIGRNGGNIVEVSHQRIFTHLPAKDASIDVSVETRDDDQLRSIIQKLEEHRFTVRML